MKTDLVFYTLIVLLILAAPNTLIKAMNQALFGE